MPEHIVWFHIYEEILIPLQYIIAVFYSWRQVTANLWIYFIIEFIADIMTQIDKTLIPYLNAQSMRMT